MVEDDSQSPGDEGFGLAETGTGNQFDGSLLTGVGGLAGRMGCLYYLR